MAFIKHYETHSFDLTFTVRFARLTSGLWGITFGGNRIAVVGHSSNNSINCGLTTENERRDESWT